MKNIVATLALSIVTLLNITLFGQEYSTVIDNLSPSEAQQLQAFAETPQPGLLVLQNSIQAFGGSTPVVVLCEANATQSLYDNNASFNTVEFIRIDIRSASDLNNSLDISMLQSFSSLKYVYLFYQYDACGNLSQTCLSNLTVGFTGNTQLPGVTVIYRLEIIQ